MYGDNTPGPHPWPGLAQGPPATLVLMLGSTSTTTSCQFSHPHQHGSSLTSNLSLAGPEATRAIGAGADPGATFALPRMESLSVCVSGRGRMAGPWSRWGHCAPKGQGPTWTTFERTGAFAALLRAQLLHMQATSKEKMPDREEDDGGGASQHPRRKQQTDGGQVAPK